MKGFGEIGMRILAPPPPPLSTPILRQPNIGSSSSPPPPLSLLPPLPLPPSPSAPVGVGPRGAGAAASRAGAPPTTPPWAPSPRPHGLGGVCCMPLPPAVLRGEWCVVDAGSSPLVTNAVVVLLLLLFQCPLVH